VKGEKAKGNKLNYNDIKKIVALEPLQEEVKEEEEENIESSVPETNSEDILEIDLEEDDPQQTLF
jgi:hypothetical protein